MKASVIIPVKNGGELFGRVLKAVVDQETPWDFEVLVIDSGSRDGSLERARSLGARVHAIDPRDFGHGRTRNLAAQLARGEYLAYLTQDAMPATRTWLQDLVAPMEQDRRIAGTFGPHLAYPGCSPMTARELQEHFAGFNANGGICGIEDPNRYQHDVGYRQFLHFFSNNNSCLRRSVWEQIPFPDVDFAEDQLWAKAALEAGYRKAYVPTACVYHSHDFGVIETLQRAFDEARAFKRYFGYDLMPSPRRLVYLWFRLAWRDWGWVAEAHCPLLDRLRWGWQVPWRVLARLSGFYLGRTADRLPAWVEMRLSRDQRLKAYGRHAR